MICLLGIILMLLFFYWTHTFHYWSRRDVKQNSLVSMLCMFKRQCLNQVSDVELYEQLYVKYPKERFVGFYSVTSPILILRDPELMKHVLISDFDTFYSRGIFQLDKVPEPFFNQIASSEGDLWKLLRQNLSPAFSTGKVKRMFPLIMNRAEKLQRIAFEARNGEIDAKDLLTRYSIDVIGACGFGIDIDTLNGDHNVILKFGQRIFTKTPRDVLVYFLKFAMPVLFMHLHLIPSFVQGTTKALVDLIMKQRNYKPSNRNDFIDLILDLKTKGKMVGYSLIRKNSDGTPSKIELEFNEALLTAQVFMYFAGGTDTTASATSYALYELGHHPEYQKKCQEEIDLVLARHGDQLTFEAIKEMKYVEACFREGLRMFTPIGNFIRKCMKRYTIPGTTVTLDPGVLVVIPAQAVHMDPQYFPDPERFLPDRFCAENAATLNKHVYMPFGGGPRACIGEQLGYIQSLAALAAVLRRASVTAVGERPRRVPLDPNTVITNKIRGPLLLKVTPRSGSIKNVDGTREQ